MWRLNFPLQSEHSMTRYLVQKFSIDVPLDAQECEGQGQIQKLAFVGVAGRVDVDGQCPIWPTCADRTKCRSNSCERRQCRTVRKARNAEQRSSFGTKLYTHPRVIVLRTNEAPCLHHHDFSRVLAPRRQSTRECIECAPPGCDLHIRSKERRRRRRPRHEAFLRHCRSRTTRSFRADVPQARRR